jgi:hypothetical protein
MSPQKRVSYAVRGAARRPAVEPQAVTANAAISQGSRRGIGGASCAKPAAASVWPALATAERACSSSAAGSPSTSGSLSLFVGWPRRYLAAGVGRLNDHRDQSISDDGNRVEDRPTVETTGRRRLETVDAYLFLWPDGFEGSYVYSAIYKKQDQSCSYVYSAIYKKQDQSCCTQT